ncbi:MAG: tyrosine-type recombinase/integrase [Melioribacteraceae bacterium]|nr:tyrosine-type recombinase/integrase [Melioribacteraceae bacterium]MCF8353921.1 tyrosine-type recombinase/integrase [Melioribacteraceae bacterium]MCF8392678.1 tyrosine-type recombinase/integrase [Melioribacteraceae bacterium]MCF8417699.1 tyrosine-type recombinase/integrase [Melioribacteraceae bacterium]
MFLVKNSKSPNYQVVYFVNGKRTTISTKTKDEKKANEFLEEFKNSLNHPQPPVKIKSPEPQLIELVYLNEFKKEYLAYIQPIKSAKYIKSIKLSFRQFENTIGNLPLSAIDVKTIDKFITITFTRAQKGAHLYYRTLKAAFTKAVAWGYLAENPFKKIKFPRIAKSHPVFISTSEFELILSKTKEPILADLFTITFYTGMRQGELVNMKWDWIDFNNSTITTKIAGSFQTKSKKERIIPMNKKVSEIIKALLGSSEKNDYVFTNEKGEKLNEDFVSKKFKKSVRAAKLNDEIHFHTLRHSFASNLVQKGVSLYVVKELLGHEDLSTTQIYSHLQRQNLKNAIYLL